MLARPAYGGLVRTEGFGRRARAWLNTRARRMLGRGAARPTLNAEFVGELTYLGDYLADAGLIAPGTAFATYRKRR